MLVAKLSQVHQFTLVDAKPLKDPGPGEIQVAVKAIGICGSDLHNFSEVSSDLISEMKFRYMESINFQLGGNQSKFSSLF